jgi:hypothetical protein
VTEYVPLRLQQLVPETCEHPERRGRRDLSRRDLSCPAPVSAARTSSIGSAGSDPLARQMVAEKVAETARAEKVGSSTPFPSSGAATFRQCKLSGEDP